MDLLEKAKLRVIDIISTLENVISNACERSRDPSSLRSIGMTNHIVGGAKGLVGRIKDMVIGDRTVV